MARSAAPAITGPREIVICASDAPRDRKFAQRLAHDLKLIGFQSYFHHHAREGLLPANIIERASAALVVLSPQLAGSATARMEYLYAIQRRKLIIPVQTGAEMHIPPELENIQWVDFYELYARGLANLEQTLSGRPQPQALRRVRRATIAARLIPFVRIAFAALLMAAWLAFISDVVELNSWVIGFLPALFIAVGEEDFRRGDKLGVRIVIARILEGFLYGAMFGLLSLFLAPVNTALELTIMGALVGGFLVGILSWLERRSLSRGRLAFHRTLNFFAFCANFVIIFLALLTFNTAQGDPQSGFKFATVLDYSNPGLALLEFALICAASIVIAAAIAWLHSPMRRIKTARRQLVAMGADSSQIHASPAASELVFISHSSGDNDFVVKLTSDLQQRGIATWMDRRRLRPGMSWPDEIRQALERSQVVLVALSALAMASEWVRHEYQAALAAGKHVIVMRMDESVTVPAELTLGGASIADFATLYSNGLVELLGNLRAAPQTIAEARRALTQRLRYAWLINTVRLIASLYLILARVVVFGVASFTLLGGFDAVAGVHNMGVYTLVWLGRAAPGALLGLYISLQERARVEGAKPTHWLALSRVLNGFITGEGIIGVWSVSIGLLFSPAAWLIISYLGNQPPLDSIAADAATTSSGGFNTSLVVSLIIIGIGAINAALAIPLARWEQRNHDEGKYALTILSRIAQYLSRILISAGALTASLYLFFLSPINPFGPQPATAGSDLGAWFIGGALAGAIAGGIELFFFPAGPSRRSLRKLRQALSARPT